MQRVKFPLINDDRYSDMNITGPKFAPDVSLARIESAASIRMPLVVEQRGNFIPGRALPVVCEGVSCLMTVNRHFGPEFERNLASGISSFLALPVYIWPRNNLIVFSYRGDEQREFMRRDVDSGQQMFARVADVLTRGKYGAGYKVYTSRDLTGNLITDETLEIGSPVETRVRDIGTSRGGDYYVLDLEGPDRTYQEIEAALSSGRHIDADFIGFNRPSAPTTALMSYKTGMTNMFLPLSHVSRYAGQNAGNKIEYLSRFIDLTMPGRVFDIDRGRYLAKFSTALAQDDAMAELEASFDQPITVDVTGTSYREEGGPFNGFDVWYKGLIYGFLPAGEWSRPSDTDPETLIGTSLPVSLLRFQNHRGFRQIIVGSVPEEEPVSDSMLEALKARLERRE